MPWIDRLLGDVMRFLAVLWVAFAVSACATGADIAVDYDKGHDFSDYKTFVWLGDQPLKVEGDVRVPKAALAAAEQAVREEMLSKGYVEVQDRADADFGVGVVAGLNQTVVIDSMDRSIYAPSEVSGTAARGPRGRGVAVVSGSGYSQRSLDPLAHMADEGKMTITIVDLEANKPVWTVTATKDFTNNTPDGRNADNVLGQLLKDFPPE